MGLSHMIVIWRGQLFLPAGFDSRESEHNHSHNKIARDFTKCQSLMISLEMLTLQ